jgi:hypothetical protein
MRLAYADPPRSCRHESARADHARMSLQRMFQIALAEIRQRRIDAPKSSH